MKVNELIYYIKKEKWDEFLLTYSQYGFVREGGFAYPDYVRRPTYDGREIRINISDPVINMWDGEDKNDQREVRVWHGRVGLGGKTDVAGYIQDLIVAGLVE